MMYRIYVDTPCGQVHARTAGSGPEVVLLLHQTASSSEMYEAFAAKFLEAGHGERYTLIAPDTPASGCPSPHVSSTPCSGGPTI